MGNYKEDITIKEIELVLKNKDKDFLIDELLKSYWKRIDLLQNNSIWSEVLNIRKQSFLKCKH
jgi:hypothetical protein